MNHNSRLISFPVLLASISVLLFFSGCSNRGWESLFNGKNLDGWSVKCLPADREKAYWKVSNGYIECNSLGDNDHNYVWLVTDQEFGNFHLKLKFQVFRSSQGNSGVQFRSRYDNSVTAPYGGWLNGPQADIHGPNPMRAGLIYDETEGVQRWIYPSLPDWNISADQVPEEALGTKLLYFEDDPDNWNTLEIICRDMLIETIVNGNPVTDFDATGILDDKLHAIRKVGTKGCIALQLHQHDELQIRFKDIVIRKL